MESTSPVLPAPLHDAWYVQQSALRRRLQVLLLPRQVLLAGPGDPVPTRLAFAHGVPAASTMAAVTFCQDKRLRRALLGRAGVSVPRGATFSSRGLDAAVTFCERIGWPVVLKEAIGENPSRQIADIDGPEQLRRAFDALRTEAADTATPGASLERAGYAQNRLNLEEDEHGRSLVPLRTRFLIEEQRPGRRVRVLSGVEPLRVALQRRPDGGWQEATDAVDPRWFAVGDAARRALPGLAFAGVELLVDDRHADREPRVLELLERPRLAEVHQARAPLAAQVADALFVAQATRAGVVLPDADPGSVDFEVRVEGLRAPGSTLDSVLDLARRRGVQTDLGVVDPAAGTISGHLAGDAADVAWITEVLAGRFALPDSATLIHLQPRGGARAGRPSSYPPTEQRPVDRACRSTRPAPPEPAAPATPGTSPSSQPTGVVLRLAEVGPPPATDVDAATPTELVAEIDLALAAGRILVRESVTLPDAVVADDWAELELLLASVAWSPSEAGGSDRPATEAQLAPVLAARDRLQAQAEPQHAAAGPASAGARSDALAPSRRALLGAAAAVVELALDAVGATTMSPTASSDRPGDPAARWVFDRRRAISLPPPLPATVDGHPVNEFSDANVIAMLPKDGTKGHLLEREALRFGLDSERFPNGSFVASDEAGRRLNFKWGRSPIASAVSLSLCTYKEATRALLDHAGVPVPRGRAFAAEEHEAALAYAQQLGYPVVCKPVAGLRGIGVVSDISGRAELEAALELLVASELGADDFVVEQHVHGHDYRIVVVEGEVVAAVLRRPASVVGDGRHAVIDLIDAKNRQRRHNPHLRSRPLQVNESTVYQLQRAGLDLWSIPEAGQHVVLANSANLSQGGDSVEVSDELHPSVRAAALAAVEAVPELGFCGIDLLLEDHRRPLDDQSAAVIELNAHAAIGSAQYPAVGTPREVAREFLRACARREGLRLRPEPAERLSLAVRVRGRFEDDAYASWLKATADEIGVDGWVRRRGDREVRAHLQGPADAVAALGYKAISGPTGSFPSSVRLRQVEPERTSGFVLRRARSHDLPRPVRKMAGAARQRLRRRAG